MARLAGPSGEESKIESLSRFGSSSLAALGVVLLDSEPQRGLSSSKLAGLRAPDLDAPAVACDGIPSGFRVAGGPLIVPEIGFLVIVPDLDDSEIEE